MHPKERKNRQMPASPGLSRERAPVGQDGPRPGQGAAIQFVRLSARQLILSYRQTDLILDIARWVAPMSFDWRAGLDWR